MKELAEHNLAKAAYAAAELGRCQPGGNGSKAKHAEVLFAAFPRFNEFVVQTSADPHEINNRLLQQKIIGGLPLKKFYPELGNAALWCCTELNSKSEIDAAVKEVMA